MFTALRRVHSLPKHRLCMVKHAYFQTSNISGKSWIVNEENAEQVDTCVYLRISATSISTLLFRFQKKDALICCRTSYAWPCELSTYSEVFISRSEDHPTLLGFSWHEPFWNLDSQHLSLTQNIPQCMLIIISLLGICIDTGDKR